MQFIALTEIPLPTPTLETATHQFVILICAIPAYMYPLGTECSIENERLCRGLNDSSRDV